MTAAFPHGACALPHWGVMRAQGADAASFLHSQLTQDITGMALSEARLAGYCSAKGRLFATFVVWRTAPDDYRLACSADVLPAVLKRLRMFVLRAKCTLSDLSAEQTLWGVVGDVAARLAPWQRDDELLRLPDADGHPRALWIAAAAPTGLPELPLAAWQWLEVRSGLPTIVAATSEQFVPQMVNLEAVNGVNFQKGCYPGQEVVARSQYRGTIKRRAFLFDSAEPAAPGQEVYAADDPTQPAGMVVNAASYEGRHGVLAEVKLAALAGAALHLGAPDGAPLQRAPLPYALPALDA
jgi:folate-binding protein YgfZ